MLPCVLPAAGDGKLSFNEFKRAFRALGLKKRDGKKMDIDEKVSAALAIFL